MKLRTALLPVALFAALAVVTADAAEAAPISAKHSSKAFFGPKVFVSGGVGVRVPLTRSRVVRSRTVVRTRAVVRPSGYWKTIPYEVYIPGRVIGYDHYGNSIVSPGRTEIRYRKVWVERAPVVVRRSYVRPRTTVGVGLGVGVRIR